MSNSTSTYSKMSKWLKWSSLFILLIPLALFGMAIAQYFGKMTGATYNKVSGILYIVLIVLSVIWTILNIILFFTAGTVKTKTSPTSIRIGLLISFVLVFAPEIVSILMAFPADKPIIHQGDVANLLWILMPLIVAIGYLVGHGCAKKAQWKTA